MDGLAIYHIALVETAVVRRRVPKRSARRVIPLPGPGVRLFDFEVDLRAILDQLRRGDGLPLPPRRARGCEGHFVAL